MNQQLKTCGSVVELIETIQSLPSNEYSSHFNLDGTWTIRFRTKGNRK